MGTEVFSGVFFYKYFFINFRGQVFSRPKNPFEPVKKPRLGRASVAGMSRIVSRQ
jgi:hypothetical protein